MLAIRFDRGPLAKPIRAGKTLTVEGHAARVHGDGDPLVYSDGPEYRDAAELRSIVSQLNAGVPVTLDHPNGLIREGARAKIVGRVDRAWLDGEHAAVRITITDPAAIDALEAGTKELSLGYSTSTDASKFQKNTKVDHIGIVDRARCGSTCAIRVDCNQGCACRTKGTSSMSNHSDDELHERVLAAAKAAGVRTDAATSTRDLALETLKANGYDPTRSYSTDDPTALSSRSDSYVCAFALAAVPARKRSDAIEGDDRRADGPSDSASRAREDFVQRQSEAWRGQRTDATEPDAPSSARDEMIARNAGAWKAGGR